MVILRSPSSDDLLSPRLSQKPRRSLLPLGGMTGLLVLALGFFSPIQESLWRLTRSPEGIPVLVMSGGDPYLRALMRTITASEANVEYPYHVIYGGEYVFKLQQHPNVCVPIERGPNRGSCSTAAGRYQFLNTTWQEKVRLYYPELDRHWPWQHPSFEPIYQDMVMYRWLDDPKAWGGRDLRQMLRQGRVNEVFHLLSATWTSLTPHHEPNVMTPHLPDLYQKLLAEELSTPADRP